MSNVAALSPKTQKSQTLANFIAITGHLIAVLNDRRDEIFKAINENLLRGNSTFTISLVKDIAPPEANETDSGRAIRDEILSALQWDVMQGYLRTVMYRYIRPYYEAGFDIDMAVQAVYPVDADNTAYDTWSPTSEVIKSIPNDVVIRFEIEPADLDENGRRRRAYCFTEYGGSEEFFTELWAD